MQSISKGRILSTLKLIWKTFTQMKQRKLLANQIAPLQNETLKKTISKPCSHAKHVFWCKFHMLTCMIKWSHDSTLLFAQSNLEMLIKIATFFSMLKWHWFKRNHELQLLPIRRTSLLGRGCSGAIRSSSSCERLWMLLGSLVLHQAHSHKNQKV